MAAVPDAQSTVMNVTSLANTARDLLAVLDAALPAMPPNRISLRLPDTRGLIDLRDVLDLAARVFDPVLLRLNEPPLQVLGVDSGSIWIEIAPAAVSAIYILQNLVNSYRQVSETKQRNRQQEEFMKQIGLDADLRKQQAEILVRAEELLLRNLAERFERNPSGAANPKAAERPTEVDHELVTATVAALKELHELVTKGAEVRFTLSASAPGTLPPPAALTGAPTAAPQLPSGGTPSPASPQPQPPKPKV